MPTLCGACRTQDGIKRSMQLKDAMRESCLTDLAEAWFNLLQAYQSASPDLAAAVLHTVERYVNWIDVSLVVNERQELKPLISVYNLHEHPLSVYPQACLAERELPQTQDCVV